MYYIKSFLRKIKTKYMKKALKQKFGLIIISILVTGLILIAAIQTQNLKARLIQKKGSINLENCANNNV
ncbi:hypothetical protein A2483_00565 [Candidatus Peregrinibacteria bacterium RIFOXYC2_FULL_33_13]|nr:MAG: hypothetical protein UR30_C0001G0074 [Candidatus Peregrinibacteria bacterium GW2011_GWC2_33_13]OGJ52483.1 MAG: hypothetical protein A2483_00565 [Candidatus Peregrinibacteria bacterium RIFOXYC2_FULL_33_13]